MKWKIKPKGKRVKTREFMLFPKYCGGCGTAYWLEWLPFTDEVYCTCGHKHWLWNIKAYAQESLAKKQDT